MAHFDGWGTVEVSLQSILAERDALRAHADRLAAALEQLISEANGSCCAIDTETPSAALAAYREGK